MGIDGAPREYDPSAEIVGHVDHFATAYEDREEITAEWFLNLSPEAQRTITEIDDFFSPGFGNFDWLEDEPELVEKILLYVQEYSEAKDLAMRKLSAGKIRHLLGG